MTVPYERKFIQVGDIRTHYLEAGSGEPLILLHSGEFGACAELSWERNIGVLAQHFHVYAPDFVGYGLSDKLFDFADPQGARVRHIRRLMAALGIERAHFAGNSMGGSLLTRVAGQKQPEWPINRMLVVSGGGEIPDNEARQILNRYDCTRAAMQAILQVLFYDGYFWQEEYLERRYQASLIPGAWECAAAARFRAPGAKAGHRSLSDARYERICVPTLIVAGRQDLLRNPSYAEVLRQQIPGALLRYFDRARHCAHLEHPDDFNRLATAFFKGELTTA